MAAGPKMLGATLSLLLLAALLPAGARADDVTFLECQRPDVYNDGRVISPTEPAEEQDNEATTLDVKDCQLTEISGVVFIRRPNLAYIYYNGNNIKKVDPSVFSGAPQIKYLFFNNNSLTEVPVFGEAGVLPNVRGLSITYNKITRLYNPKTFSSMKELRTLNLENNLIEYVSPDVLQGVPHLDALYLSHNKLKYIPDNTFAVPSLTSLSLANNLIEYVSPGAFSGTKLKHLYLYDNKLTYLPEHFVASLTSTGGKLEYLMFHDNPFKCSCLSELLAEVKQLDNCDYEAKRFNDPEKPACSEINDTQCKRLNDVVSYISQSTKPN